MVEPDELLRSWPGWQRPSADKVLASPAWRMDVSSARTRDVLTIDGAADAAGDEIPLKVKLDASEHVLGIRDSASFPDLHLLWAQREKLESNLLLALVEKECGALFVMLEQVFGREFSVVGLAESVPQGARTVFRSSQFAFSLDLSSELRLSLGDMSFLDPRHESIRMMTRPARADYGAFVLDEATVAALGEGDVVPLGANYLATASWALEDFSDGLAHVVSADETSLRFADFADETLPAIEPSAALRLVRNARVLAEGELFKLGDMPCFRLTHMHS